MQAEASDDTRPDRERTAPSASGKEVESPTQPGSRLQNSGNVQLPPRRRIVLCLDS